MKLLPVILILTVYLGANFYLFFRLWHMIPGGNILRTLLIVFAVLALSSLFLGILLANALPSLLAAVIYKLGTSWVFILLYMLMLLLLLDLLRITRLLPLDKYMFSSWTGFGIVAGSITLIMTVGYVRYLNKERVELDVAVNKDMGEPLKIVAASDLHLGYGIGKKEFEGWVEKINRENPDIVVFAGDMIDNSLRPLMENDMGEIFRKIEAKYGVFVVPGNHEYISGIGESLDFLHSAGVTVLRDSSAIIDGRLYIVGRDDAANPMRKSISSLIDTLDRSKPVFLLDHQPRHLEEAADNGVDLQFSGHTHRGQVWPISCITDRIFEDSHGLLKKGKTNIYVSSGLGIWGGKFRIGTRSEYVVITLRE